MDRQAAAFDRQLAEDLKLLHRCNRGSEHTPEMLREQVKAMARKYSWVNAKESQEPLVTADELENLTIQSGTLTAAERQIIDKHVVSTIRMLAKLPYPKKLRNIPAAAGSHHERMDGTGYPNRLEGDAIPIAGRIIGLADVFEALTAQDRPYKKAKSLAEAMRILREMAQMRHIDPELYEIFESHQIHVRYATAYLDPNRRLHADSRLEMGASVTSRSARAAS